MEETMVVPPVQTNVPAPDTTDKPPTKSEYSGIGIIVAILLAITLVVFVQFLIGDVTESFFGKTPTFDATFQSNQSSQSSQYAYTEKATGEQLSYEDAQSFFNQQIQLPYASKKLLVNTAINVPLFLIAVVLLFSRSKLKSAVRLAANAYFVSNTINMLKLLGDLAAYTYQINQKLTMYGVSLLLIVVFVFCIFYVQEKHHKESTGISA